MSIDIKELSEKDLQQKIDAIKAEREKTADALKQYEEEIERRKNENWLPLTNVFYSSKYELVDLFHVEFKTETIFNDYSCFDKYRSYLETLNKELVSNAKGEQIDIKVLFPLLRKGWVAMDENGKWFWFSEVPELHNNLGTWDLVQEETGFCYNLGAFNIKPAEDWTKSLQECGLCTR